MTELSWQSVVISQDVPILEAIRILDEAGYQICLVLDEQRHLIGTITDGDVRRGFLRRLDSSTPVSSIMNRSPFSAAADTPPDDILDLMRQRLIHQVPLVDGQGCVVGLSTMDALVLTNATKPNWVVLMAGGLGTRLAPLTDNQPKPLILVGKKPVLETILESLIAQNFRKFYISVNHKAEMVMDYFGDGNRWGVEIRYLQETERLGTAGPLGLIEETKEAPLLVMNADLLTKVNFEQMLTFHREHKAAATMAVREYDIQVPFGVVCIDDAKITRIDEKPVHSFLINAGMYVFEPDVLDRIASNKPLDMPDFFQSMIEDGHNTTVFPVREYWLDIGRHDDLKQANIEFEEHFNPQK